MKRIAVKLAVITMIMILMAALGISAALAETTYNVWVGSTRVTENNRNDILGDGGKAKYDPSDHTLTLNNPSVSGTYKGAAIYADGDLTVSGSGSVTGTNYGILTTGSCAITGGSLDISATDDSNSYGIDALEITISGGTVKAGAKTVGIFSLKKTVISGGTVTATAPNGTGIASPDLNISGGTVTAEGASSGMSAGTSPASASFTGGTIKAIGSGVTGKPGMASGIWFETVEIGNSITSLTADGDYSAISGNTITIGSDLMIKEPENGKVAEQSGVYSVMKDDGTTIATHALIVPMGTYEITTKHVPAGGGAFLMTAGPYYEGKQVQIILNIFSGYDLDKMTVQDAHGNDIPVVSNEFIMPASDVTVTAYYKTDDGEYFITVTDDGNGTASASAATAAPGEEVTLSATPNAGYRFKEWQVMSGGVSIVDNKFTMGSESVEIKAIFETAYTITVTNDGNGTGTASPDSGATGIEVMLAATPKEGYQFKEWQVVSGGITVTDNKFTIGTADVEIKAVFEEIPAAVYTVTVSDDGNGTGTASPDSGATGIEVMLAATPKEGYQFKEWQVVSGGITVTDNKFTIGTADVEIKAVFEEIPAAVYTVTISDDGNGTGTASPDSGATGIEVMLAATPKEGYQFKEWQVVSGGITVTDNKFIMGSENVEIKAIFEEIPASVTYTVTFDANGHGTTPASQTINSGEKVAEPTATTEIGWIFGGWYTEAACTNAFDFSTPITGNITLYAKWTEESITPVEITYTVTSGGNSTWIKDSDSSAEIIVKRSEADNTCFSHFSGVQIDGTTLAAGDYEAKSGSTVITLKAATLQKLSAGSHTVTINFDDGKAETKLTVKAAPKPTDVPKTGDSANFPLWLGLILLGLIGISVLELTAIKYRK